MSSLLYAKLNNEAVDEDKRASEASQRYFKKFVSNIQNPELKQFGNVSKALVDSAKDEVNKMKEILTKKLTILNEINTISQSSRKQEKSLLDPLNQVSNNGDFITAYNNIVRLFKQKELDNVSRDIIKNNALEFMPKMRDILNEYMTLIKSRAFGSENVGTYDFRKNYLLRVFSDYAIYNDAFNSINTSNPYYLDNNSIEQSYINVFSQLTQRERNIIKDLKDRKQKGTLNKYTEEEVRARKLDKPINLQEYDKILPKIELSQDEIKALQNNEKRKTEQIYGPLINQEDTQDLDDNNTKSINVSGIEIAGPSNLTQEAKSSSVIPYKGSIDTIEKYVIQVKNLLEDTLSNKPSGKESRAKLNKYRADSINRIKALVENSNSFNNKVNKPLIEIYNQSIDSFDSDGEPLKNKVSSLIGDLLTIRWRDVDALTMTDFNKFLDDNIKKMDKINKNIDSYKLDVVNEGTSINLNPLLTMEQEGEGEDEGDDVFEGVDEEDVGFIGEGRVRRMNEDRDSSRIMQMMNKRFGMFLNDHYGN